MSVAIPNRKAIAQQAKAEASMYFRDFDARRYAGYVDRMAKPFEFLDSVGIDKICELVEHGNGLLNIARMVDLSSNTLRAWISKDPQRIQKVELAKEFSGDAFAYKAEQVLKSASGGDKSDILIAGKLADHYRWMAEKLYRVQYGLPKDIKPTAQALVLNINYGNEQPPQDIKAKVVEALPTKVLLEGISLDMENTDE